MCLLHIPSQEKSARRGAVTVQNMYLFLFLFLLSSLCTFKIKGRMFISRYISFGSRRRSQAL